MSDATGFIKARPGFGEEYIKRILYARERKRERNVSPEENARVGATSGHYAFNELRRTLLVIVEEFRFLPGPFLDRQARCTMFTVPYLQKSSLKQCYFIFYERYFLF